MGAPNTTPGPEPPAPGRGAKKAGRGKYRAGVCAAPGYQAASGRV